MDDDYLNEVLPRWQFWKEYLIEQLEEYMRLLTENSGIFKACTEMLEKIEKVETAKDLRKIPEEIENWKKKVLECSRRERYPSNFYPIADGRLLNMLNLSGFSYMINKQTNKEITK